MANTGVEFLKAQLGGNGTLIISGTSTYNNAEQFIAIQVLSDAVIAAITDSEDNDLLLNDATGLNIGATTLPAGTIIHARKNRTIKSIQLTSGLCVGLLAR